MAYRQLVALGLGRGAIERRLARGRLFRVHRGVFAVGHARLIGRARWAAATLACGDGALLSHQSAAALWGFRASASARVDVTTRRGRSVSRDGIRVHHARRLHPDDGTIHQGIPVTAVPRTLLDLAEVLSPTHFRRAFEEADRLELIDMRSIDELVQRSPGRHGLRLLSAVMAGGHDPPSATRSELERRFFELCRSSDLPLPSLNVPVAGVEVDALWPDHGVVVELDGYEFHRHRAAFERDRRRDAKLQLAGYRVLRITHRRLQCEPSAVIETVRALMGDAG